MSEAPDAARLALNTATVKLQWTLAQAIEGCARHGIRGIAPWRDQLAAMGVKQAARAIKAKGLTVTGSCRGGFFTARDWQDDKRRAIDLPRIRSWVEGAGYTGVQEVEIFSELDWWRRDPDEVLRTLMERHQRCS